MLSQLWLQSESADPQLVSIVEMESEGVMVISDLSGFLEIM